MLALESIGTRETPAPASLDDPQATPVQRVLASVQAVTERRDSLLVVGLRNDMQQQIRKDFASEWDLRFVAKDESKDRLRTLADRSKHCIVMTDFIGHSHEDIVKARHPGYTRVSGGMTHLREAIAGLRPQGASATH